MYLLKCIHPHTLPSDKTLDVELTKLPIKSSDNVLEDLDAYMNAIDYQMFSALIEILIS